LSANLLQNSIGIDQAKALASILKEHSTLKSLCGNTGNETELDMSSKISGADDAIMLVTEIVDNEAILSVNLLQNSIGIDQAEAFASILKDHLTLKSLCGNKGNETELDMCGKNMGPSGAIMLAAEIANNRTLTVANVMGNRIGKEQLSKLQKIMHSKPNLMSLCGIPDDATEADLSSLGMDADDAIVLASELPNKGVLSKLIFVGETYQALNAGGTAMEDTNPESTTLEVGMTESDLSNKNLRAGGAIIVAAWVSHNDKGTLLAVNLLKNSIGTDQAKFLASILKEHPTLKSLCGNKGSETKLDMSGKMHGAGDAIMLVAEIIDNGALSVLNLADNCLGLAVGWKPNAAHEGWFSGPNGEFEKQAPPDMSGIATLVCAISDMRAISKFTFSGDYSNSKAVTMETTMAVADFSEKGLGASGAIMLSAFLPKCT
jgi:hypothetical protein